MRRITLLTGSMFLAALVAPAVVAESGLTPQTTPTDQWSQSFDIENCRFSDTGRNTYFILEPDYRLVLQGVEEDDTVTLVITVLKETEAVDGVVTRVVEERESANGELVEVSRNFFAFCTANESVFYFGEDVDIYEDGKVVDHGGSWRAGHNGFRPGLMMPGLALLGSAYYQEIAPGVAMDRARIINADTTIQSPSVTFEDCLVTEETSAIEAGARENKCYAPGVGLIRDGQLWLVSSGVEQSE